MPQSTGRPAVLGSRWAQLARVAVATAGFAAAVWAWDQVAPDDLPVAALAFTAPVVAAAWLGVRLRAAVARSAEALARVREEARVEAADVLGTLSSGVVTVDAAGRLLYANAAADALLGVAVSRRLGEPVLAAVGARAPGLAHALERAAAGGERTTRAEAALGASTLGVTTTVGADPGGARTGTAIFSDITASRQLAEARRRAERLEAVAELAASLAHEIRNPLASIRSAVEQLARLAAAAERAPLGTEGAADAGALAGLTVRESDRLSRLLGEFLDFSRARVTRRAAVDVAAAARDAARLAAAHPDAAGVAVRVEAPSGELVVDGDAELLHRALCNLVLNAAQATAAAREGGAVRVTVEGTDGGVAVHVADEGAGVAPEVAERLFEPFVTTRAGGTGLGLAVVQRAVEAHGGVVLVEAGGGGVGARFTCVLPAGHGGDGGAVTTTRRADVVGRT